MFEIQPRYLEIVLAARLSPARRATATFEPQVAAIREAFALRDEGTVPCNNDLLAENFMMTPTGCG